MKRNEQAILLGVAVVGLLIGFWLVIVSPKRNEASKLQDEINQVRSSLSQAQQEVETAKDASRSFGTDYRRLVVLGKAVPADTDQASLLVQLQDLADRSGVDFQTIDLADAGTSATPTPAPTTSSTDSTSSDTTSSSDSSTVSTEPAVPSEAAVATLPIGAAVGPAGLPVMPYSLGFKGGFFEIADFMARLDGMVGVQDGLVDVSGRLVTIDGFTLTADTEDIAPTPELTAELSVTTFLTPADQGIGAGATPSGPAPVATTTTSSTTVPADTSSTATSTPTSTSP